MHKLDVRRQLVDGLAAGPGAAEDVDPQVVRVDVDLAGVVDLADLRSAGLVDGG